MNIYFINIDARKDRRMLIENQLKKLNIKAKRISATTPKDFNQNKLKRTYKVGISAGEIGCVMSHRKTWEEIIKKNLPYALIFEDDIIISKHLPMMLNSLRNLNLNFNLIRIETDLGSVYFNKKGVKLNFLCSIHQIYSDSTGTGAYIISQSFCRKLLNYSGIFEKPLDITMFRQGNFCFNNTEVLQVFPGLVTRVNNYLKDKSLKNNYYDNFLISENSKSILISNIETSRKKKNMKLTAEKHLFSRFLFKLNNMTVKIYQSIIGKRSFVKHKIIFKY